MGREGGQGSEPEVAKCPAHWIVHALDSVIQTLSTEIRRCLHTLSLERVVGKQMTLKANDMYVIQKIGLFTASLISCMLLLSLFFFLSYIHIICFFVSALYSTPDVL